MTLPDPKPAPAMLTPVQADEYIRQHVAVLERESTSLANLAGKVLRQEVRAERDQPPFDRVTMDGVALCSRAAIEGRRVFALQGVQGAGARPLGLLDAGNCIEIMTGAVLPAGCDCVIPTEKLVIASGVVNISPAVAVTPWLNVHRRGFDGHANDLLISPGVRLGATHIAVIASAGLPFVEVTRNPRIMVISTGDELIEPGNPIEEWQIRSSNGHAIGATLKSAGFADVEHAHLTDEPRSMRQRLQGYLDDHDVLVLSGGVSMGRFDYVPETLIGLGVRQIFHKIAQRPGLPMWFGIRQDGKCAYALPGNPVSTQFCLVRYVLPALRVALGEEMGPQEQIALGEPFEVKPALTYFLPVRLQGERTGAVMAVPQPTKGSGDFISLLTTNGFVELRPGPRIADRGEVVPLYRW